VREVAPLVARGGLVLLMKGPNTSEDETAEGAREAKRRGLETLPVRTADVPGLERRLVLVYRRS
jgi:16S rRNA G527 N7-methylase RsmG